MKLLRMTGDNLEFYKAEYISFEAGYMGSSSKLYDFKNFLNFSVPLFLKV